MAALEIWDSEGLRAAGIDRPIFKFLAAKSRLSQWSECINSGEAELGNRFAWTRSSISLTWVGTENDIDQNKIKYLFAKKNAVIDSRAATANSKGSANQNPAIFFLKRC